MLLGIVETLMTEKTEYSINRWKHHLLKILNPFIQQVFTKYLL